MRVLLSTIGTRGDVQPLLGLAMELVALGHRPTVCAPPNFGPWIAGHALPFVPLGPDLRALPAPAPGPPPPMTREMRRQLAAGTVAVQFQTLTEAARGHELVVGAGTLQLAARSVAEAQGSRYVFAGYCPLVLPSREHPPVRMDRHHPLTLAAAENEALWAEELASWDELFGEALDEGRARLGLPPVQGVLEYVLTERPWLASDPVLGPGPRDRERVLTGAWRLSDPSPLPEEVQRFLGAGEPPVYLGLGSTWAAPETGRALLEAARAVGRRALLSRGWAELEADDRGTDWLSVDDLPHDALFPQVAAVVHHGGAGTTTTAALAGRPQVVLPQRYDQFYWGQRLEALGVGVMAGGQPLQALLEAALEPERAVRAAALAPRVVRDGAQVAARLL